MGLEADMRQLALIMLVVLATGAVIVALLFPLFSSDAGSDRMKALSRKPAVAQKQAPASRFLEGQKDSRRKQVQETLRQIEDRERQRKRTTQRMRIAQAGLEMSLLKFWAVSCVTGALLGMAALVAGLPWYLMVLSAFVGLFGLPRWFLSYLRKRRQDRFLDELPDAIDVMVRGLRAGLPMTDAMRVIASETGAPVGPEFLEMVEGQRVGITIELGLERMYERMPLQELNFLAIVMNIQSKTGGSLTETLANLSKVLRDRRKMKSKVKSVSQEAKSSAAIIGALPFVLVGFMAVVNPGYLQPLLSTSTGNAMLLGSGIWMAAGIIVMRKMINFNI